MSETVIWTPGSTGYVIDGFDVDDSENAQPNVLPISNAGSMPQEATVYFVVTVISQLLGKAQAINTITIRYRTAGVIHLLSIGLLQSDRDGINNGDLNIQDADTPRAQSEAVSVFAPPVLVNDCVGVSAKFSIGPSSRVLIASVGLTLDEYRST